MTYSVNNININKTYTGELISVTPSTAIDLSLSNSFKLNMDSDYAFDYDNAENTTYNFIVEPNGSSFSFGAGTFSVVDGENVSLTASFLMSGIYDGDKMWIALSENYLNL